MILLPTNPKVNPPLTERFFLKAAHLNEKGHLSIRLPEGQKPEIDSRVDIWEFINVVPNGRVSGCKEVRAILVDVDSEKGKAIADLDDVLSRTNLTPTRIISTGHQSWHLIFEVEGIEPQDYSRYARGLAIAYGADLQPTTVIAKTRLVGSINQKDQHRVVEVENSGIIYSAKELKPYVQKQSKRKKVGASAVGSLWLESLPGHLKEIFANTTYQNFLPLFRKHYPKRQGHRQLYVTALTPQFLELGFSYSETQNIVKQTAIEAGDMELSERRATVKRTYHRYKAGLKTDGLRNPHTCKRFNPIFWVGELNKLTNEKREKRAFGAVVAAVTWFSRNNHLPNCNEKASVRKISEVTGLDPKTVNKHIHEAMKQRHIKTKKQNTHLKARVFIVFVGSTPQHSFVPAELTASCRRKLEKMRLLFEHERLMWQRYLQTGREEFNINGSGVPDFPEWVVSGS